MRVVLENGTAFCCCSEKELCVVPENALAGTVVSPEQYKREDVPTTWPTKSQHRLVSYLVLLAYQ